MAGETLLTVAQTLASMPDNTVGAISAQDQRSMIVSEALGLGFYSADAGFDVTITDGVYNDINSNAGAVSNIQNLAWELDGNNAWRSDYTGVIVPAGVTRLVVATCRMQVQKATPGVDESYLFQYHVNGLPVGNPIPIDIGTAPEYDAVAATLAYEVVTASAIDLRVQGVGTSDDLHFNDFRFSVTGAQL